MVITTWITPKTDWNENDRVNISDYNRIKNNLIHLHELAVSLWKSFEISDMGMDIDGYEGYWDVDVFNMFETNLDKININIFPQDFGVSQRFFENGPFIKWDELNRIESASLKMKNMLESQKKGIARVAFRLGNYKGVKV